MKKSLILIITIILAIALIGTLAGCKPKENPDSGKTSTTIQDLDFMNAVNKSKDNTVNIYVRMDGEVVYSYVNGKETKIVEELDINSGSFTGSTTALNYSTSSFSNQEISDQDAIGVAVYSADIASPADFLGISGNITNAKINIEIDRTNKSLNKINITYDIAQGGYDFAVELIISSNSN